MEGTFASYLGNNHVQEDTAALIFKINLHEMPSTSTPVCHQPYILASFSPTHSEGYLSFSCGVSSLCHKANLVRLGLVILACGECYHSKPHILQVQQVQSGDSVGGPSSADQQNQQAADLQNTAQQPDPIAPSVPPAKPLEPPEPDQYTVRPNTITNSC